MHIVSMKEMYQIENDLGTISYDMSRVARNNASNYATISVFATIVGLITLCLFVGLLVYGNLSGAAGCFTCSVVSFIILKMSVNRMRYAECIIVTYLQRHEVAKFKQLIS